METLVTNFSVFSLVSEQIGLQQVMSSVTGYIFQHDCFQLSGVETNKEGIGLRILDAPQGGNHPLWS
jgi:hypothetical protein